MAKTADFCRTASVAACHVILETISNSLEPSCVSGVFARHERVSREKTGRIVRMNTGRTNDIDGKTALDFFLFI